ncbi:phosphopyruvate hydratase [Candidatus Berkelbacteria bacterium]|nr:phosphopyruvate hydratase [Candidatus Berkelbacteria bacterium]
MATIRSVTARTIIDSRAKHTLEVDVLLSDGSLGRASVPSGASTGSHEAARVDDPGLAVANAQSLGDSLIGQDPSNQERIDLALIAADGTPEKSRLGANVILALSLAVCEAAAHAEQRFLFEHIHAIAGLKTAPRLPTPLFNIINGGKHADNNLEIQEFMIVPTAAGRSFRDQLEIGVRLFHELRAILKTMGHSVSVGDEGGFAPRLNSNQEALELLVQAIDAGSYRPQTDVTLALDVAASSIADLSAVTYPDDPRRFYERLVSTYPISLIEDPLTEDDWQGWTELTAALGSRILIVGDDLYTTNPKRLRIGIERQASNAVIIKPDQVGTLTETLQAVRLAEEHGLTVIVSHRSGETESTFIADLAVGVGASFLKTGAPSRGERVAKYNQLLRIEEQLARS